MVEGLKSHTLAKRLQSGAALLENSAKYNQLPNQPNRGEFSLRM
jgi:hypothetical protein